MNKQSGKLVLASSVALLGLSTAGATFAGGHTGSMKKADSTMVSEGDLDALGITDLGELEDVEIVNNEEIGEVDRIAIDRNTRELLVVVGLDGILGVNMKEVTIPISKLTRVDEDTYRTTLTKDELQQRRDVEPWDGTFAQTLDR